MILGKKHIKISKRGEEPLDNPNIFIFRDNVNIGSIKYKYSLNMREKHLLILYEFGDYDFYSYENRNNEWNNDMLYSFSYIDFTYFYYDTNLFLMVSGVVSYLPLIITSTMGFKYFSLSPSFSDTLNRLSSPSSDFVFITNSLNSLESCFLLHLKKRHYSREDILLQNR